jgi:SAM-dependent methyltransferase
MNLSAKAYHLVQKILTGDSSRTYDLLQKSMGFKKGDTVVDIGCGTGLISKNFTNNQIGYLGCDLSNDRIAAAKSLNPKAQFINSPAQTLPKDTDFTFSMVHGVLHHMPDSDVNDLLTFLKLKGCQTFGAMEPGRPLNPYLNPLAAIYCDYIDDGDFIRGKEHYLSLLSPFGKVQVENFRYPLVPVTNHIFCLQFT